MKKVFVCFVLAVLVFGSCSSKQKIVGTWTDVEGNTWVFRADGKLVYSNRPGDSREYRYIVFDGERRSELIIYEVIYDASNLAVGATDQKYNLEYSTDGKTIRLTGGESLNGWSVADPGWSENRLTRK